MNETKLVGIVLIVAGVLALIYGGFSYTKKTNDVDLGIVQFQVNEKERVNVPLWVGIAAIAGGAAVLALGPKRN